MTEHLDLTGYLLGELDGPEREAVERRLREDPEAAAQAERLAPTVSALREMPDAAWEPVPPPPLDLTFDTDSAPPRGSAWFRGRLTLRPVAAVACGIALLAAGVGIGAVLSGSDAAPGGGGQRIALAAFGPADPAARGSFRVTRDGAGAVVNVSGLAPTANGRYYELWLMNSGRDLVSLGGFRVDRDGHASVRIPLPADVGAYRYVDVSLETTAGPPGHSSLSVLRSAAI